MCDNDKLDMPHCVRKDKSGRSLTHREVRARDLWRLQQLRDEEFSPQDEIWEIHICHFDMEYTMAGGVHHDEYKLFLQKFPQYNIRMSETKTETEILQDILHGRIYGFVCADFDTPAQLRERFDLFPCFFKVDQNKF